MLGAVPHRLASFRLRSLLALAVAGSAALACIPRGELVARDGSRRMMARDPATGISVVLTLGAWEGNPADLDQDVTVIHVLVANMGQNTVRLAPGDLELRDDRGFQRELLDAGGSFVVDGETDRGYHPGRSYDFGRIEWNGGDVGATALPWGMLKPGTQMRGYVYFQRVDNAGNAADLTWHFYNDKDQPLVDLAFDLYVARNRG
jgi:hypothetical protein